MNEHQVKRLKQFYYSISNQRDLFYRMAGRINYQTITFLAIELEKVQKEFPGLLPEFRKDDYEVYDLLGDYDINGIRSYLASAEGILKGALDETYRASDIEERDFVFVHNGELKQILHRDFLEIQKANNANCWKAVIILCGGSFDAILLDLLLANDVKAKASSKAPKKPDITHWHLSDLIDVAVDLKLVTSGVEKLSHPMREYRNLVHPGNEFRNKLTFDAEEAKIALEVLNIVYRDLKP